MTSIYELHFKRYQHSKIVALLCCDEFANSCFKLQSIANIASFCHTIFTQYCPNWYMLNTIEGACSTTYFIGLIQIYSLFCNRITIAFKVFAYLLRTKFFKKFYSKVCDLNWLYLSECLRYNNDFR